MSSWCDSSKAVRPRCRNKQTSSYSSKHCCLLPTVGQRRGGRAHLGPGVAPRAADSAALVLEVPGVSTVTKDDFAVCGPRCVEKIPAPWMRASVTPAHAGRMQTAGGRAQHEQVLCALSCCAHLNFVCPTYTDCPEESFHQPAVHQNPVVAGCVSTQFLGSASALGYDRLVATHMRSVQLFLTVTRLASAHTHPRLSSAAIGRRCAAASATLQGPARQRAPQAAAAPGGPWLCGSPGGFVASAPDFTTSNRLFSLTCASRSRRQPKAQVLKPSLGAVCLTPARPRLHLTWKKLSLMPSLPTWSAAESGCAPPHPQCERLGVCTERGATLRCFKC